MTKHIVSVPKPVRVLQYYLHYLNDSKFRVEIAVASEFYSQLSVVVAGVSEFYSQFCGAVAGASELYSQFHGIVDRGAEIA